MRDQYPPLFEIDNELEFVVNESKRLSEKYRGIMIIPLLYSVTDNKLNVIMNDNIDRSNPS